MHKCTFCIHQVKLFIHFSPCILDCGGIVQAAYGTMHLGQISAGYNGGRLVIDTNFEACGTPVNKLHRFLRFDLSNRHIYILGCNLKRIHVLHWKSPICIIQLTSPRYRRHTAMYFPVRGSHLTIWYFGSKQAFVISGIDIFSW